MALLQWFHMVLLKCTTSNTYQLTLNCALILHVTQIFEHGHPKHVAKHQIGMRFHILILGPPSHKLEWKGISNVLISTLFTENVDSLIYCYNRLCGMAT